MAIIEIKNRWNGKVLYSGEHESLGRLLKRIPPAILLPRDLPMPAWHNADLAGADLAGADLGICPKRMCKSGRC